MKEIIQAGGKTIHLIGTAHISQKSTEEVLATIAEVRPDNVCVELCESRYRQLTAEGKWKEMDIVKVIKTGNAGMLFSGLLLASYQKRMGEQLGVRPGQEMLGAIDAAKEQETRWTLIDREVNTTIKRTWRGMSFWEKMKVMTQLMTSFVYTDKVSEDELESLKDVDIITAMMDEMGQSFPNIKKFLIDERDQFMAEKLLSAEGDVIVAVVGAGHVDGMKKELNRRHDLAALSSIPPKGKGMKYIQWGIPAVIIGIFLLGFLRGGFDSSREMIEVWVISHALLAGIGCFLAGGGILSTASAAIAAPFTSLNPMIAAGWVAGLVEAYRKKPTVADFEELSNLKLSYMALQGNAVTRILMVVILTNLGNSLATWISGGWFLTMLK